MGSYANPAADRWSVVGVGPNCNAVYCTVLHRTALYYPVLYCTVLYCIVVLSSELYNSVV